MTQPLINEMDLYLDQWVTNEASKLPVTDEDLDFWSLKQEERNHG
jgi:hypothetical protein